MDGRSLGSLSLLGFVMSSAIITIPAWTGHLGSRRLLEFLDNRDIKVSPVTITP